MGEDPIREVRGVRVLRGRRQLVSFAGCDTLGLARRTELADALRAELGRTGVGASASRTTTGTFAAHVALERALARFAGTQDAVVLPSGWMAPQALAVALASRARVALLDAGAHPALRDAATLSGLPVRTFPRFAAAAARRAADGAPPLVLTDSVDLVRGRLAPLRALRRLVEDLGGALLVDDAHGVGVLGAGGRGAVEAAGAQGPRVHVAGSLAKALGTHGGFVASSRTLCGRIRRDAAPYAGATPLPPAVAAAAAEGVRLAAAGDALRRRVRRHARRLRAAFSELGLPTPAPGLPWFTVSGRSAVALAALSRALAGDGFLVPHLRYFGGPREGCLKIAPTAAHSDEDVARLVAALRRRT